MEAACGVVRYFKGCGVAPFEGMVNRGTWPELPTTSCVRSLPLLSLNAHSLQPRATSISSSSTASLHSSITASSITDFLLLLQLSKGHRLQITVISQTHRWRLITANAAASAAGRERSRCRVFLRICKQKETTVYRAIY